MTDVINCVYVHAFCFAVYVCMKARSVVMFVYMCSRNPKPRAQIRAAKPNSTNDKESEGINTSTSRRESEYGDRMHQPQLHINNSSMVTFSTAAQED
jgi:hypothetical protein